MTIVHDPGNTKPIDCIYIVLSVDDQGREGIVGTPLPMVTSEPRLAAKMFAMAKYMKSETAKQVRLAKFSEKKVVEQV